MRKLFLCIGAVSVLAAAVSAAAAQFEQAVPDVRYGVATCQECRQILTDKRLGAVFIDRDGLTKAFDDSDCLARYVIRRGLRPKKIWVRDFYHNRWIDAYRARYYDRPKIRTERGEETIASATDDDRQDEVRSFSFDEFLADTSQQLLRKSKS